MIFGAVVDDELKDSAMITVIATGIRGATQKAEREAPRERKPAPARLTPRPSPHPSARPSTHRPPERSRREPSQPTEGNVMVAKEPRRNSRRELEIPTFLRRQMD
jgi:cell division GTPase FtsZ